MRILTAETLNNIKVVNDDPISHTKYEHLIENVRIYRDVSIDICREAYPALKYQDIDILRESMSVTGTVVKDFFIRYKNTASSQYDKCIYKLRNLIAEYKVKCDSMANVSKFTTRAVTHTKYVFIPLIPNLEPLYDGIGDIRKDYDIFMHDKDGENALGKLYANVNKRNNDTKKKITCNVNVDAALRGGGARVNAVISESFLMYLRSYHKTLTSMVSSIENTIGEFITLICDISKELDSCPIKVKDGVDFDLKNLDPQNAFYRYELAKFSNMFMVITDTIYRVLTMIEDNIKEYTELLDAFKI